MARFINRKKITRTQKAVRRQKERRRRRAIQEKLISTNNRTTPRSFDPAVAQRICDRYADGEPMLSILNTINYPTGGQFYTWVEAIPELDRMWQAARRARAHSLAEETLEISDAALKDKPAYIPAHVLRVRTRQWLSSKLRPETYGEHVNMRHDGALSLVAISATLKQREVEPPVLTIDGKPVISPVQLPSIVPEPLPPGRPRKKKPSP